MLKAGKKVLLGAFAGIIIVFFGKKKGRKDEAQALQKDFKISTQRLGVVFGKKVRDVFRFRWLRKVT